MHVRIGFLHNKKNMRIKFTGEFSVIDRNGEELEKLKDTDINISVIHSEPAVFEWYEKLETFYKVGDMEKIRTKYYFQDRPTRIIKVGKEIGKRNNFEYWILKKTSNMDGKVYPTGDYRYKKLIKKESTGTISIGKQKYDKKIIFKPIDTKNSFMVKDVSVGIQFHWDHKEDLEYTGSLEVIIDSSGNLTAINIIDIEDYLASVNSSEMRNDNNIEMLKAQTVAARSTVLATMGKHHFSDSYDLCADDHCQCYQGSSKISELSRTVAEETKGEILVFGSEFVDARYSKSCGGIIERYSTCWEDMDFPYLRSYSDDSNETSYPDKMSDKDAERFVNDHDLDCFCNTFKNKLPESLDFCRDFFRWSDEITLEEIRSNLYNKFGKDIGEITDIKALKRGNSGRIFELELTGSTGKTVISKELNIRRLLSDSHLPSSAFIFEKLGKRIELKGAGWGHGVGLCQIGAQIMGEKGYSYDKILKHYYRGVSVKKI